MRLFVSLLSWFLRAAHTSRSDLVLENLALRQQLATYARTQKRHRLKPEERAFWAALSHVWSDWRSPLVLVKPATVIDWHRRGFQRYWRWRSRKPGRPRIPAEHIALIRRVSIDQPAWGEDRSSEELGLKLGTRHSTSTIRKYMVRERELRRGQTWRTFIRNHASQVFAADFLTQYTALFTTVYVFVVMHVTSRRIVLINATASPGLAWVKQQIRQATAWARCPRFLLHDNDGVYGQYHQRSPRGERGRSYRCHLDVWLADAMGIKGIPIPYGAPNASPHIERFNRTLREEALNHFIFLGVKHVLRVCREYVEFYNRARPSQALHAVPDPYRELKKPPPGSGKLVALPVLAGVQHDYRLAA
jgi:putative transposase